MSLRDGRPRSLRRGIPALLSLLVAAAGCAPARGGVPRGAPTLGDMARALGRDVLLAVARGYVPDRSGDVLLVPEPWNVLGQWNGGVQGPDDPRTTHATPWSYHQRIPVILYGPGYVRDGVRSDRPVDLADLAPTFAGLLGSGFDAPEGRSLREALLPAAERPDPLRALVVVAYDGGGWNVLERWPDAWPVQRRLADAGTLYTNAVLGSAPSLTAPVHATMGTGAYPRRHGLPENTARRPDGTIGEMYLHRADPALLRAGTVADAWDAENGNRAWVGMIGFESWHLGMMGAGARVPGGDRDVSALWKRGEWGYWTNREVYRLPAYLPARPAFERLLRELDAEDGARDDQWLGNDLFTGSNYTHPGTPAFVRLQSEAIGRMLEREPIGRDDVTDLVFIECKSTDYAGHIWNMGSEEVRQVLAAQDRLLADLVRGLDERVGRGRWVLAITADHGQTPIPTTTGGLRIDRNLVGEAIDDHFGADIVEALHPSELYLDRGALEAEGITLEEVARFVGDFRLRDALPAGIDTDDVTSEVLDRRVFAAALPGRYIEAMTPAEIAALGPGRYPEGDLTSPPPLRSLGG